MADQTQLPITGDWRVIVQSKNAGWQQRVLATGTANGTQVVSGVPGARQDILGNGSSAWQLRIQHNDGTHGWQDSWVRLGSSSIGPGSITQVIESEDVTTPSSDRDFNDLVVRLEKLGMVDQPARPFAVLPSTMQMMADGIFETTFGRYFMGVRVRNVWTHPWPAGARVGLTQRSRQWLQAAGVQVIDSWSQTDAQAFGQDVAGGRVLVEGLQPWSTRTVYFKVDVQQALPRKHQVEVEVNEPISHIHPRARAPMLVTRTTYDSTKRVFVSECDRGKLTAAVKELAVDYNTLKRAVYRARELFQGGSGSPGGGGGGSGSGGSAACHEIDRLRQELIDFLNGKPIDICDVLRRVQCCCAGGRGPGGSGTGSDDPWTGKGGTGMEIVCIPTLVDYRVDYRSPFAGQYGPIPFDDPWWKVVLAIIAIILALGAAASAAADLANGSNDVVIGEVTRSVLDNLVDAAVVRLNGNRSLTGAIFSYLDAATGEQNTVPLVGLGGLIDTPGTIMTNAEITAAIAAFNANPTDPTAAANVRVFKSGARTGLTFGRLSSVGPSTRDDDDDGVADRTFQNQVIIVADPTMPNGVSDSGDSGSLWIHTSTLSVVALNHAGNRTANTAIASRIEDVMSAMGVRFS
jgi:hypothetical protein